MELFAHIECTPHYDRKPEDGIFMAILLDVDYDLGKSPALIGLLVVEYTVVFRLGEF